MATSACEAPEGWVDSAGDCDDADDTVYPGATEVCDDEVDHDCNGKEGDCRFSGDVEVETLDDALSALLGDEEDAYLSLRDALDVDGDGLPDLVASGDEVNGNDALLYYVPGASLPDAPTAVSFVATATLRHRDGEDDVILGAHLMPDLDGDGYGEISVSINEGAGYKKQYVTLGHFDGDMDLSRVRDYRINGDEHAVIGDYLGRGAPCWATGDYTTSSASKGYGTVYCETTEEMVMSGDSSSDKLGAGIGAAPGHDVDGDGQDDVWFGAPGWDSWSNEGCVYLALGGLVGDRDASDADAALEGAYSGMGFGTSLVASQDLDGDGLGDLLARTSSSRVDLVQGLRHPDLLRPRRRRQRSRRRCRHLRRI